MKKIVFFAALTAFIGCNSVENIHAPTPDKWKLKSRVANRMIGRMSKCGFAKPCDTADAPRIVSIDTVAYNMLSVNYTLTATPARYIKINKRDYGKLRNLPDSASKVKGYLTQVYEAVPKTGPALAAKAYYDLSTICPPPRLCPTFSLSH